MRAAVHELLESALAERAGRPVRIAELGMRPLEAASTYPIDRLDVRLDSGERLKLVFKRLTGHGGRKGDRREVLVYERLLVGGRFGAPLMYAAVYDEETPRYWLLLEDVGDTRLRSDPEQLAAAVRWLGELHGTFAGRERELVELDCLGDHDARFYLDLAEASRRNVALGGSAAALERLDSALSGFDATAAWLAQRPRTLVHGDILKHNLLVQPGPRIRPVDWESAAIGVGELDLALLIDGWGRRDRAAFLELYRDEVARHAGIEPDAALVEHTLAWCDVVTTLWYLAGWPENCDDPALLDRMLTKVEGDRARAEAVPSHA